MVECRTDFYANLRCVSVYTLLLSRRESSMIEAGKNVAAFF